jgi:hypothetical protein
VILLIGYAIQIQDRFRDVEEATDYDLNLCRNAPAAPNIPVNSNR